MKRFFTALPWSVVVVVALLAVVVPSNAQVRRVKEILPNPTPTPIGSCDFQAVLETGRRLVGRRTPPLAWPPAPVEPCFNEMCKADRAAAEGQAAIGYASRLHAFEEQLYACEVSD